MRTRRFPFLALVAVAALASLGGALADEALIHTDDGCVVEIHCLACRLTLGSTAVPACSVTLAVAVKVASAPAPEPAAPPCVVALPGTPSRAPPTA